MTWKCAKQNKKTQWFHIAVLLTIPAVLFILQRSGGHLAGTSIDWISQHTVFPDYFRQLFYETGNIFPQYAAELGGGQNIYNFAYYGLYSPLYLLSYLLPFVKMSTYIQVLSFALMMADGVLCYVWLNGHFESRYSFFASFSLVLSLPVIFHSTAQIMFVNYMPFLILAFIGYDRYLRTSGYGLLTGSVFLMILTSFYFAVGGLAALFLYGMSGWKKEQASSISVFAGTFWHRFYPVLLAGFLSMFYLVPVFCAMTAGRSGGTSVSLKELLVPDVGINKFLYSPYGLGLTAIIVIGVCTSLFYKACREKWLGILTAVAVIFPVFSWILNGGLYVRDKALIPLLTVVMYLFAGYLQRLGRKELAFWQIGGGYVAAAVVLCIGSWKVKDYQHYQRHLLYLDLVVCLVILLISQRFWKQAVCYMTAVIFLSMSVICINLTASKRVPEKSAQQLENEQIIQAVKETAGKSKTPRRIETRGDYEYNKNNQNRVLAAGQNLTTCYSSISNSYYQAFRREIGLNRLSRNSLMQDTMNNPVFLSFMGVRYLVGQTDTKGYDQIEHSGNTNIYENKQAAPLFYLTDQTISNQQYKKLNWASKQLNLLENAVADSPSGEVSANIEETDVHFAGLYGESLIVNTKKDVTRRVQLGRAAGENEYLFLEFSVKNINKSQDMIIKVNGEQNKLSGKKRVYYNENEVFHYTCAIAKGTDEITVDFGKGHYEISDIEAWFGTVDEQKNETLYQEKLNLVRTKSGDGYAGTSSSSDDKWLITSIPYDDNFQIYVDGKPVQNEKVNSGFLGAKIEGGEHRISIKYSSPGRTLGMALSGITIIIVAADYMRKNYIRRKKRENENNSGQI